MENEIVRGIIELKKQEAEKLRKEISETKNKLAEVERLLLEEENKSKTEKLYSEKDLYDFVFKILYDKYFRDKRIDIINGWAKECVEAFKLEKKIEQLNNP